MFLMKTEAACGRCPLALLCMSRRPLPDVRFCRRCGAIMFKRDDETFLCLLIREGIHSRVGLERQDPPHFSMHDHRMRHVLAAVWSKHAEYTGCTRLRAQKRGRPALPKRKRMRWDDCVQYFNEVANGFDREF